MDTPALIIDYLRSIANPDIKTFKKAKYNIDIPHSLGIYHSDLKELIKQINKSDELALALFDSGIYEAQILCSKIFSPKNVTPQLMEKWVASFSTWEICDSYCMSFLGQTDFAYDKVFEWVDQEGEFRRRAGFVLMVGYHFGHKQALNTDFEKFIPLIEQYAFDDRNFVKKAVNWALRTIGKRNPDLTRLAVATCENLLTQNHKSAHWIAKDALREFSKEGFKTQRYPRETYG
ncbi:MAG: DNA alkylation repair protein [Reichenbachiella sp.]